MSYVFWIANLEDVFKISGLDVQGSPKSGNETGNTGYPKVYIFLMKKSKMITSPGSNLVNLDLTINIEYKKLRRGSQIMVGFIIKTKAEKANTEPAKLFPFMISFKTTSENTITGKSGLGDCENKRRNGIKQNWIQVFSWMIYTV